MTVTPLIGQDIGAAFRATRNVLDLLLDREGTPFLEWVTLRQLASTEKPIARDELLRTLAPGGGDAPTAIAALAANGDVTDDGSTVALTPAGEVRYRALERQVVDVVDSLYVGIAPADMATTKRVLAEITERASAYAA
jgi:hypothetical protein